MKITAIVASNDLTHVSTALDEINISFKQLSMNYDSSTEVYMIQQLFMQALKLTMCLTEILMINLLIAERAVEVSR